MFMFVYVYISMFVCLFCVVNPIRVYKSINKVLITKIKETMRKSYIQRHTIQTPK